MIKKYIRKVVEFFLSLNIVDKDEEIYKKIQNYKYISFDMFDTLIKRNIFDEKNVFKIVQEKYNKLYNDNIKFYEERINAEKEARLNSKYSEVNIFEIYEFLKIDNDKKEKLMELENETEVEICVCNKRFMKIYEYCLKNNKKIYICSDMYLPRKTIEKILKKCGYDNYSELYLSSEKRKTKRDALLYKEILSNEEITKKEIIHIGDNCISDFLIPRLNGIESILIRKYIINSDSINKKCIAKNLYYNYLCATCNNLYDKKDYNFFEEIGLFTFSPMVISFCISLRKYITERGIEKVYFLARDAKIILDVYKILYPEEEAKIYYMYISRKAMIFPNVNFCKDIKEFEKLIFTILDKDSKVYDIYKLFEIESSENLSKNGTEKYMLLDDNSKVDIFMDIKEKNKEKFNNQKEYLKRYLEQLDFNGKVCLVDVGWRGTIQNLLFEFCKNMHLEVQFDGYYFGILNKTLSNCKGLLYNYKKPNKCYEINKVILSLSFFETLFLSTDGSTIKYGVENEIIVPLKKEKDNNEIIEKNISMMHSIVCTVSENINKNILELLFKQDDFDFMKNYEYVAVYPNRHLIENLKKVNFENNGIDKIINNKSIKYYMFHVKELKKDFFRCKYKIAFAKDLFKIKLPYYRMLNLIKKYIGGRQ